MFVFVCVCARARAGSVCSKKQRQLAKAIKRARFINLIPYLHKHPDYLGRKDSTSP